MKESLNSFIEDNSKKTDTFFNLLDVINGTKHRILVLENKYTSNKLVLKTPLNKKESNISKELCFIKYLHLKHRDNITKILSTGNNYSWFSSEN